MAAGALPGVLAKLGDRKLWVAIVRILAAVWLLIAIIAGIVLFSSLSSFLDSVNSSLSYFGGQTHYGAGLPTLSLLLSWFAGAVGFSVMILLANVSEDVTKTRELTQSRTPAA